MLPGDLGCRLNAKNGIHADLSLEYGAVPFPLRFGTPVSDPFLGDQTGIFLTDPVVRKSGSTKLRGTNHHRVGGEDVSIPAVLPHHRTYGSVSGGS